MSINVPLSSTHSSFNHLSCSDVGNWDRQVIQDILKEIAQTQQVDLNAAKRFKGKIPTLMQAL